MAPLLADDFAEHILRMGVGRTHLHLGIEQNGVLFGCDGMQKHCFGIFKAFILDLKR